MIEYVNTAYEYPEYVASMTLVGTFPFMNKDLQAFLKQSFTDENMPRKQIIDIYTTHMSQERLDKQTTNLVNSFTLFLFFIFYFLK